MFHKIKFDDKSEKRKETGEYYHKRVISVVICDLELLKRLTIFQIYIATVSFIGAENQFPEKFADLQQVTDNICHIKLHRVHIFMGGIRICNL